MKLFWNYQSSERIKNGINIYYMYVWKKEKQSLKTGFLNYFKILQVYKGFK